MSRADDAGARVEGARTRRAELDERLRRLRNREPATADDVDRAGEAAADQLARSTAAYRSAAEAHHEAARHHRRASDALDGAGHPEQAAEHRRRATVDDEGALADGNSADADGRG